MKNFSYLLDSIDRDLLWRIKDGQHIFDIIPYTVGKNDPDLQEGEVSYVLNLLVHYMIGKNKQTVICRKTWNKCCPICDMADTLKRQSEGKSILDVLSWRRLRPKKRCLYNVIVRDTKAMECNGIMLLEISHYFSERIFLELASPNCQIPELDTIQPSIDEVLDYIKDLYFYKEEPMIVYSDPEEGKSISFRRMGSGSKMLRNVLTSFVDRPRPISNHILDEAYCLDAIIKIPSFSEVYESIFSGETSNNT